MYLYIYRASPTTSCPTCFLLSISINKFTTILVYPREHSFHFNISLSNIKQPRRDTATFANEGPPATYLSLGVGKGRKEAINVIMGKGDRLLVVVERRLCCLNTKDLWTSGRASVIQTLKNIANVSCLYDVPATIPAVRLSPVNKPGVNLLLTKARKENEGKMKRALG
ncbi:hypothetical protein NEUTE2DRAFT_57149 [Neurospora tetrasperma FGSC 2509]|nr:hypothetical protein NEUTE2DRAFT_57149 [Neurospora tetrasperma FGSC 2509]